MPSVKVRNINVALCGGATIVIKGKGIDLEPSTRWGVFEAFDRLEEL